MNRLVYPYSLCLLLLLLHVSRTKQTWPEDLGGEEEEEFIKNCQTNFTCGGIDVSYPFRLNSTLPYCGVQGLEVSCSAAGDAVITLHRLGPCKIIKLDGFFVRIKLLGDEWAQCPLKKLSSTHFAGSIYLEDYRLDEYTLVNCSSEIATDPDWITGPFPCLGNESQGQWVYAADASTSVVNLPSGCQASTGTGGRIRNTNDRTTFEDLVQGFIQTLEMNLYLNIPELEDCGVCHGEGKQCGFSRIRNQTACFMRTNQEEEEEEEFIKDCETNSACGGIDVRYPFRLNLTPAYCGLQGFEVSCSAAGDAMVTLPRLGPCKIIKLDNDFVTIEVQGDEWAQCPLQKLSSIKLTGSIYDHYSLRNYMLVNCSSEIETDPDWIMGPIPCLSDGSEGQYWVYAADASVSMDQLPSPCEATGISGRIGYAEYAPTFQDHVQRFIRTLQMNLYLDIPELENCEFCYGRGKECGFSRIRNQTACFMRAKRHDPSGNYHPLSRNFWGCYFWDYCSCNCCNIIGNLFMHLYPKEKELKGSFVPVTSRRSSNIQ